MGVYIFENCVHEYHIHTISHFPVHSSTPMSSLFFCHCYSIYIFSCKTSFPEKHQGLKVCQPLSPSSSPQDAVSVTFLMAVTKCLESKVWKDGLIRPYSLRGQSTMAAVSWPHYGQWGQRGQEPPGTPSRDSLPPLHLPEQYLQLVTKHSNAWLYWDI